MHAVDLSHISPKRRLFLYEYIRCGFNATKAALAVGFSKKSASSSGAAFLKEPQVAEALTRLVAHRSEELKIDSDWVLTEAVSLYRKCLQEVKVLGVDGLPTGVYRMDTNNAVKLIQVIGKHTSVQAFKERELQAQGDEIVARLNRTRDRLNALSPDSKKLEPITEPPVTFFAPLIDDEPRAETDQPECWGDNVVAVQEPSESSGSIDEIELTDEGRLEMIKERWGDRKLNRGTSN